MSLAVRTAASPVGRRISMWLFTTLIVGIALATLPMVVTQGSEHQTTAIAWTVCAALAATFAGVRWSAGWPKVIGVIVAALTTLFAIATIALFALTALNRAFADVPTSASPVPMVFVSAFAAMLIPLVWMSSRWAWVIAVAVSPIPLTVSSGAVALDGSFLILTALAPLGTLVQTSMFALRLALRYPWVWFAAGILMSVPAFLITSSMFNTAFRGQSPRFNDDGGSLVVALVISLLVPAAAHCWWLIEDLVAAIKLRHLEQTAHTTDAAPAQPA